LLASDDEPLDEDLNQSKIDLLERSCDVEDEVFELDRRKAGLELTARVESIERFATEQYRSFRVERQSKRDSQLVRQAIVD
jgi:hypothetical protein